MSSTSIISSATFPRTVKVVSPLRSLKAWQRNGCNSWGARRIFTSCLVHGRFTEFIANFVACSVGALCSTRPGPRPLMKVFQCAAALQKRHAVSSSGLHRNEEAEERVAGSSVQMAQWPDREGWVVRICRTKASQESARCRIALARRRPGPAPSTASFPLRLRDVAG